MDIDDGVTLVECNNCGTDLTDSEPFESSYGNLIICHDCVTICERCEDVFANDDDMYTVDGNDRWCRDCTEYAAHWCDHCEEWSTESSAWVTDRGSYWCQGCADNYAAFCDECDNYYADGCTECGTRVIHDYSYRPDPIFHSTDRDARLYFGIEVEVESPRRYGESSEYASQLEPLELAYLKHDGSLNCGFEIVTHPMTHDFYHNEAHELWSVLEGLRTEFAVKSWDTQTCGVHIHISRSGFNGGPHMHRFLNLVYSNQHFFESIAGRSSSRWAKFDDVMQSKWMGTRDEQGLREYTQFRSFKDKLDNNRSSDRYSAVNTQNTHTLEMRIFRGTVKGDTIKSYLDLAHASVEYTRTLSVKQLVDGAMSTHKFIDYIYSNPELYHVLIERMERLMDVNSIRLNGQKVSN